MVCERYKAQTLSWITICFGVTLQGIDYGIIIPSMFAFMMTLAPPDQNVHFFFGIVLSAFSLSSLVTAPIFGWAFDRFSMKKVMLILTVISLLGSVVYALAVNNYMILIGRVLCGVGYNIFPGSSLYVVQTTDVHERSGYFAMVTMTFSIALALGPAINFPISKIGHHPFGPFVFSEGSAPAWVMAFLFVLSGMLYLFMFTDPVRSGKDELRPKRPWYDEWKQLLSNTPCTILIVTQALVLFTQTSVETILTPLTRLWYQFDVKWNSLLFTGMVGVIVVFLVLISYLTKVLQDRVLLMIGHIIAGLANVLFVVCLVLSKEENVKIPLYQFCIVCATYISAIAFYQSILGSLFSKLLNNKALDGRGQSLMSGASALGSILGPLTSMAVMDISLLYIPSIMGCLWSTVLFLLISSWDFMYVEAQTKVLDSNGDTSLIDEDTSSKEALLTTANNNNSSSNSNTTVNNNDGGGNKVSRGFVLASGDSEFEDPVRRR
eukprot:TRINITY_DN3323_c0_g3_i6.p1 TRINITY_DN3323_c0_g3~~TRINITY_DN3323_c0_g3_i6.p1  ORF type:complete len:492 (-),score=65.09 TRINITY_DN3323_c0_g3_i6:129-1604(-)